MEIKDIPPIISQKRTQFSVTPQQQASPIKRAVPMRSKLTLLVLFLLVLIFAGLAIFSYRQYKQNQLAQDELQRLKEGGQPNTTSDTQKLVEAVGRLMVLPKDETPTVATVTDLDKLKNLPFFVNAKVDDKVLIYVLAGKAILYRPGENKIVEVAPFNSSQILTPSSTTP